MDDDKPPRTDGFSWPPHNFQLASWALYLSFVGTFYALFLIALDDTARIVAGTVYGVIAVITLAGAMAATGTNPADPLIFATAPPAGAVLHHCYRCNKSVQPSSKHCTICRKCVDVFDRESFGAHCWWRAPRSGCPTAPAARPGAARAHPCPSPSPSTHTHTHTPLSLDHCVWLNNCVGKQNIVGFYTLLAGAGALMLTQIAVGAYAIYAFTTPLFAQRLATYYPSASPLGIFVVLLAIWLIAIAVEALVLQLLSFHSLLVLRDLTTYDFIVQRGQERQGIEVVPGHGSSLAIYCRGYRKASPMAPQDHAAAAALQQQQQQHPQDVGEVGLELRSYPQQLSEGVAAAMGGGEAAAGTGAGAPAGDAAGVGVGAGAGAAAAAQQGQAPAPLPPKVRVTEDPYADWI